MHAQCGILREPLRAADVCFGHRLMMDAWCPAASAADLSVDGRAAVWRCWPRSGGYSRGSSGCTTIRLSLQAGTATTGIRPSGLARQCGAGGYVGRASGRGFDARKALRYMPYGELSFEVPTRDEGDVNARVWIRIKEVEQSLSLIDQIMRRLPDGPFLTSVDPVGSRIREGIGLAEGFRGDVLAWVRLDGPRVARCHLRDPSWFQWPLLEAVIEGNIVADFPLCNKSFNCSYSGHDL